MRTAEFEELCERVCTKKASTQEAEKLVQQAIDLRWWVVWGVDQMDRWDQDWEVLGYDCDDDEEEYDALRAWFKRQSA